MHHDELLFAATFLLSAGIVSVVLFQRAGFGSVLGLLITGVLAGPSGFAITSEVESLRGIAEIGIAFLLFIIGLEMEPKRLWGMRRAVFGLGLAQVLATAAILSFGAVLFGNPAMPSIIMGLGLALSSTAFVIQMLEESGELVSSHGETAFSILIFQDLAIVPLLMLVGLLAGDGQLPHGEGGALLMLAMVAVVILAGLYALPAAMAYVAGRRQAGLFTGLAVLAVLVSAWAMEVAGLSMALGAFLMGMLLSRSPYHHQIEADVAPFKGVLLSLFFISVGMSVDLAVLTGNLGWILAVVFCIILAKLLMIFLTARLFGNDVPQSIRVAFLLAQAGEFGFVLFGAAQLAGLIGGELYVQTVIVISISMAATPVLAKIGDRLASRFEHKPDAPPGQWQEKTGHVVICGYGRIGRTISAMFDACEVPYVAIERRMERLKRGPDGRVVFGNATDYQLLAALGIGRAALVVVTLDSPQAARHVVSMLRNYYPAIPIIVRARDLVERDALRLKGATDALPETVEHAMALGQAALRKAGIEDERVERVTAHLCMDDFAGLRALEADLEKGAAKA